MLFPRFLARQQKAKYKLSSESAAHWSKTTLWTWLKQPTYLEHKEADWGCLNFSSIDSRHLCFVIFQLAGHSKTSWQAILLFWFYCWFCGLWILSPKNECFLEKSFWFLVLVWLLLLLIKWNRHEDLPLRFYFVCFACYLHARLWNFTLLFLGDEEIEEALMIQFKIVFVVGWTSRDLLLLNLFVFIQNEYLLDYIM